MHEQVAMRVADGIDGLQEQAHARVHVEPLPVAPAVDGHALHVLHHEVRIAIAGETTIEQRAMCGWRSCASIWRSRRKRSRTAEKPLAARISFSAARCW